MSKTKLFIFLQTTIFFFSLSGVCTKLSGGESFLSVKFFLYYGLALFILFVYAIIWQQILRGVPLTTAYANRSVTVVWSMLWGALLFQETIRWNMIIGAAVIMVGIYFVVTADE